MDDASGLRNDDRKTLWGCCPGQVEIRRKTTNHGAGTPFGAERVTQRSKSRPLVTVRAAADRGAGWVFSNSSAPAPREESGVDDETRVHVRSSQIETQG